MLIKINRVILNTDLITGVVHDPTATAPQSPIVIYTSDGRAYGCGNSEADKVWDYLKGQAIDLLAEGDVDL